MIRNSRHVARVSVSRWLQAAKSKRINFKPNVKFSAMAASTVAFSCLALKEHGQCSSTPAYIPGEPQFVPLASEIVQRPSDWRFFWDWIARLLNRLLFMFYNYSPAILTAPILLTLPISGCSDQWWVLLRQAIQRGGPCSIKLAQWISTRPDLFPTIVCQKFQHLQSNHDVPSWSLVEQVLIKHYGADYSRTLQIQRLPDGSLDILGGGCVAQVLRAKIHSPDARMDGHEVAVKIIHPHVKDSIVADIDLMRTFAGFLEYCLPSLRQISLLDSIEEFSSLMLNQVDMRREAENLERFRKNFEDKTRASTLDNLLLRWRVRGDVHFPAPYWIYTNEDVLVESHVPGKLLRDVIPYLTEKQRKEVANIGLAAIFKMIFIDNYIHADLHPGNIVVLPSPETAIELCFIDAGLAVELERTDRYNLIDLFKAVLTNDGYTVGKLMIERSRARHKVLDPEGFAQQMGKIVSQVHQSGLTLEKIGVSALLQKVLILCFRHQVKLESRFASVIIAMGVVEGLGRELDPTVDILQRAAPYVMRASAQIVKDILATTANAAATSTAGVLGDPSSNSRTAEKK